MVKMTLARDDGVIDRVEGKAAIGLTKPARKSWTGCRAGSSAKGNR